MGIFEFLKNNPIVWILILIAVAVSVIILFTKYLVIDNWDKIFKKKVYNDNSTELSEKSENKTEDNVD